MSALTTRMLVLGVVRIFGPANGYQLRRELLSWEVERWAHLNPGSIYSMLSTLEKQGAIERHDIALEDGGRPVAVYTMTDAGRGRVPEPGLRRDRDGPGFRRRPAAAGRAQLRAHADPRSGSSTRCAGGSRCWRWGARSSSRRSARSRRTTTVPPHVVSELGLEIALVDAQLDWLRELDERRGGGRARLRRRARSTARLDAARRRPGLARWPRSATVRGTHRRAARRLSEPRRLDTI